ncbi:MAG: hypothetical protein AABX01_02005 [Candidatus Micrarchaeota archaeon]
MVSHGYSKPKLISKTIGIRVGPAYTLAPSGMIGRYRDIGYLGIEVRSHTDLFRPTGLFKKPLKSDDLAVLHPEAINHPNLEANIRIEKGEAHFPTELIPAIQNIAISVGNRHLKALFEEAVEAHKKEPSSDVIKVKVKTGQINAIENFFGKSTTAYSSRLPLARQVIRNRITGRVTRDGAMSLVRQWLDFRSRRDVF